MMEWLIDSILSAWFPLLLYWVALYIICKVFSIRLLKNFYKIMVIPTLVILLMSAFSTVNRPKFNRVPDQSLHQKSYESEIEYKASKNMIESLSIQEQHKDLVEETKKKFEY